MKSHKAQTRRRQASKPNRISDSPFDRKLARYALAGSALLAAPFAANADIVFSGVLDTTANDGGSINVSFDNSATIDFSLLSNIYGSGYCCSNFGAFTDLSASNGVEFTGILPNGASIGASFTTPSNTGEVQLAADEEYYNYQQTGTNRYSYRCGYKGRSTCYSYQAVYGYAGPFTDQNYNPGPEYLGFKFTRSGQTFYGWAEVQSTVQANQPHAAVKLIDYAYNNTPNAPILEGDQSSPTPEPSSIALFALGAIGIAALRRRRLARNS